MKKIEIGYPMEYEDDKHIIRTGLWLKEYEVELLEKKLKENEQLKKQKEELKEFCNCMNKKYSKDPLENSKVLYVINWVLDKINELEGEDK